MRAPERLSLRIVFKHVRKTNLQDLTDLIEACRADAAGAFFIARNIRRMRLAKSWSQHDLANEGSARQALISSLDADDANPTLESLDKIAGALGVRLAELLAEK